MTLSEVADFADLIAAIGVIATLLFLAFEVRRNTTEIKRTSWESVIDRFHSVWASTAGDDLADIIDRGRNNYISLPNKEKIGFHNYHYSIILAYESMLVLGRNQVQADALLDIPKVHLQYYFGFSGAQDWWKEASINLPPSPLIADIVNLAIQDSNATAREGNGINAKS